MSGNTLGTLFTVTTFGESHGPAIGCVIDGCPPGMSLSEADIQPDLDRRKPGTSRHVTQRREEDKVEILSGVYEGKTTGTPIALLIRNEDQRSKDYAKIANSFRPGHADYTYLQEVRHSRSARGRAVVGSADRAGGGRGCGREEVAEGEVRRGGARLPRADRAEQDRRSRIWDDVDAEGNPFFAPIARACPSSRRTWTSCASPATRAARGSTSSRRAFPRAGASRSTGGWTRTSPR